MSLLKVFLLLSFTVLFFSVFYFSWLPNPSFKTEHYLPNWLIRWTDEYGRIRTGVPFVLLGANAVLLRLKVFNSIKIFLGLFMLLCVAEFGQLFLPHRHFDYVDILVGSVSIGLGIFLGEIIVKILSRRDVAPK